MSPARSIPTNCPLALARASAIHPNSGTPAALAPECLLRRETAGLLGGPRLWRSPAAARPSKVRRKTLTRGEMSWLLRLGFATTAVRCRSVISGSGRQTQDQAAISLLE